MKTPDYLDLDTEILYSITKFPGGSFQNIYAGKVAEEAQKIDPKNADKVTHQRMQFLQKEEILYQHHRKWYFIQE